MDIWTQILDFTSLFVTPVWNSLIQYLPVVMLAVLALTLLYVARIWLGSTALNRSRIPARATSGPLPAGVHLPGPSIWPFFIPVAGFFVLLSLVIKPSGTVINPLFLGIGVVIGVVAIAGWYRDAGREWQRTEFGHELIEAGARGDLIEAEARGEPIERPTPEGIHLPGPSGWPFLAPFALLFIFGGLVFGPVLIVAGLVMGFLAALGWYLDAGNEYRQVEAGHLAEPRTRDPKRAFPRTVFRVYIGIAVVAVVLTLSPWLLTMLPSSASGPTASGSGGAAQTPSTTPTVSASSAVKFDEPELVFAADQPITLTFDNNNAGVPHNVGIYDSPAKGKELFKGDPVTGVATATYNVPALSAGTYYFQCDIHPNMHGDVIVK
jgi:plastocyanin